MYLLRGTVNETSWHIRIPHDRVDAIDIASAVASLTELRKAPQFLFINIIAGPTDFALVSFVLLSRALSGPAREPNFISNRRFTFVLSGSA